jgi:hypothetical protein
VIKLIVANAMESHGRIWGDHEIQCGARWPAIKKGCWWPAGCNSLVADKCDAHETAGGVRLELEQFANLFGTQIIVHSSLNFKRARPTVHVESPGENQT